MKKYLLIANDEHSHESTELGTIRANSLSEAALFLAYHFPNHYYLANIVKVKESEEDEPEFMAIACSEYYAYENNGVVPNPVEVALHRHMMDMKYNNEMYDIIEDYMSHDESITYQVWESITSSDNRIVKDNREEA